MRTPIAILMLLLFCSIKTSAQHYLFDAQHITTDDGLANLMTHTTFMDSQGFLWISTRYGLNRYDGYTFQLYTKEKNGLYSNKGIHKITEDEEGNLWLFYNRIPRENSKELWGNHIDIFNPNTGLTTPFDEYFKSVSPFLASELKGIEVSDSKKRIWLATKEGAVYLYQKGVFKKVFKKQNIHFEYLSVDSKEQIWLGWEKQLICVNMDGIVQDSIELANPIAGLWSGENNKIWLSTFKIVNGNRHVAIWTKNHRNNHLEPFNLSQPGVDLVIWKQIVRTQKGYWYLNINDRLHLFDPEGKWLLDFHTLLEEGMGAGFHTFNEYGNQCWFATPSGVIKTNIEVNPFNLIHSRGELSDCRNITEDKAGDIYFLNSKVYKWSPQKNKLDEVSDIKCGVGLIHTDTTLWFGVYSNQIVGYEKNINTNQIAHYSNLGYGYVKASIETDSANVFLTGHQRGLAYLDLTQKKQLAFNHYNGFDQLRKTNVHHFYRNKRGIWISTESGVFLMDPKKGIVQHFSKGSGGLPFDHILYIHETEDGVFWLATKGGGIIQWTINQKQLGKITKDSCSFRQFTTENDLSNNYTYAIYGDDYNNLWITSDKGLMCMDKETYRIKTYLKENGLPHNEFNFSANYQAKDGTLYFGGLGGLIAFHPKVFANEADNETALEFIGYHLLEEGAEKMADKTSVLKESDKIVIRPTDKLFELRFSLLDYDNPEFHTYAYKIEGYTNYWNHTDENYIRITNLPAGDYVLKVKGKNNSKGWSEKELSLHIQVLKPFYLQWWFISGLLFLVLAITLTFILRRETYLKKDRERLETEVLKRTLTIQQQAEALKTLDKVKTRFFSNITHELRTPLTLILGPLEQIVSEPLPQNIIRQRLSSVLKNAQHLLGLINQMLDLSKIESGRMKIEASRGDIVAYTKELTKRFHSFAEKKGQRLNFIAHQGSWATNFDKAQWDKIIYNLLSNALKFTPPNKAIQISLTSIQKNSKEFIRLDVKDTGIGIEENQLLQIFNRFYQADGSATRAQDGTGIGLALVKELVELQGGEIQVSSELNKGTSFEVLLPVLPLAATNSLQKVVEIAEPLSIGIPIVEKHSYELERAIGGKLDLLIVEDNEEVRAYIRSCLDASKYNIIEATDGEQGIQKAQAIIPDLIISDVMMPKKDGFELTQTIRNNISTSHIPLILLTAKAALDSRLEGLERGADAYLTKPFSPKELALRINKLIEIRHGLQERYQTKFSLKEETYQKEDPFIINLREYILQNIDEPDLNGDRIGKHLGMSRVHLYRKLKALTNQAISEFIRSVRLKKAEELIQEGKLNISEIAWQTGFSSVSHFSKTFKKVYGKTPSKMKHGVKI